MEGRQLSTPGPAAIAGPGEVDRGLVAAVVAAKFAILALAGTRYGFLSDELYFFDAAANLAFGYVDFPPMIAWWFAAIDALFGTSLVAVRAVATTTGIAVTLMAIDLARLLGCGRPAQWLVAGVVLFAPAFLSVQSILTMNVIDQLVWVLAFWCLAHWVESRSARWVFGFGCVLGIGVLTKLSILGFVAAFGVAALLLAPFGMAWIWRDRAFWGATVLGLVVASPFIAWQVGNEWPFLEFIGAYNQSEPEAMVINQPLFGLVMTMNPPFAAIWVPGIVFGLVQPDPRLRLLTLASILCLALFLSAGVKFYFATPLFVVFTIAGALWYQRLLAVTPMRILAASMVLSGVMSVPIAAPVLPAPLLQQLVNFMRDGLAGEQVAGDADVGPFFPHFAEMHGWPELVTLVEAVYADLAEPPPTLFAAYYGQAGALNRLDRNGALPAAVSGHMSYHLWNGDADLARVVFVGFEPAELAPYYESLEVRGRLECIRCMQREQDLPVVLATRPRVEPDVIRDGLKRYWFF